MKTFFNGTKVHAVPPDLFSCAFVTDFQEKKNIFNTFFTKQCTLFSNNSVLLNELTYMTQEHIHSIAFIESDVIKIRTLDVNKVHGYDNILVRMITISTFIDISKLFYCWYICFPPAKSECYSNLYRQNDKQVVPNY